ncbi:hypothetical protein M0C34_01675 [Agarivorans sp. TSD2052]|uniref:hypothetical protein n=1 Tax=Agarivorans sp. TSD2052 TaxID=2937286 RepID=UPI00200D1B22|nr:hypothetical protein [Agarivorans sp. TSD2052]UPW19011.1 hypothetical protein M0C34_01675 [Agarivorans sp. TSD2052]
MKLWKSLLITSIALTSLNTFAAESGQNFNQSAKHSTLAGSTGLKGSGQVAVSAVTTPVMIAGGISANVGSAAAQSGADSGPVGISIIVPAASVAVPGSMVAASAAEVANSVDAPVPFEIGELIVIR